MKNADGQNTGQEAKAPEGASPLPPNLTGSAASLTPVERVPVDLPNPLFPVFLKLEKLNLLLVGGGNVALEKLGAILSSSPNARIKLVAREISGDVRAVLSEQGIPFEERAFAPSDLSGMDLAIIAVNDKESSLAIQRHCKEKQVLTNVADKPELCDFYLGSIVQKGNLKIGISTNGKSPTIAKRVKEVLNETIPAEVDELLNNMANIRNSLSGDFSEKVRQLNDITRLLSSPKNKEQPASKLKDIALYILAALFFILVGYFLIPQIL